MNVDLSFIEVWVSQFMAALQVFQGDAQTAWESGSALLALLALAFSFVFGMF